MPGANKIKQLLAKDDFGEAFYLVDSDYRTQAQGWTKADHTGPLDLYEERNPGYVFRTGDYASDAACMQAAINAQVDFRGDMLYFTPGNYTPAAALVLDVPDARWMGSRRRRGQSATITAGVADALGSVTAADSMEFAYLRFVPLTAGVMISRGAGSDNWWLHDFVYDARGITADVGTIFMKDTGACLNTIIEDFIGQTNTALGPLYQTAASSVQGIIKNFSWLHSGNTLVTLLFETITGGAGATCWQIGPGHVQVGGGGAVTNLGAMINMTANATNATLVNITTSVGGATTALGWEATTGVAAEGDIVNSWVATIAGGAGRAALVGTT